MTSRLYLPCVSCRVVTADRTVRNVQNVRVIFSQFHKSNMNNLWRESKGYCYIFSLSFILKTVCVNLWRGGKGYNYAAAGCFALNLVWLILWMEVNVGIKGQVILQHVYDFHQCHELYHLLHDLNIMTCMQVTRCRHDRGCHYYVTVSDHCRSLSLLYQQVLLTLQGIDFLDVEANGRRLNKERNRQWTDHE